MFFQKLSSCINNATLDKYENVVVIGDINIDGQDRRHPGFENLKEFCDVFGLENLVKVKTCFTRDHSSSIDVILINRKRNFQKTSAFETGLSGCHSLIATRMKSCTVFLALSQKKNVYRNYKKFSPADLLSDVKDANLGCISDDPNAAYEDLVCNFRKIVVKHAPLRTKTVRGNDAPFMNKHGEKKFIIELACRESLRKTGPEKMNLISKSRETNAFPLGGKQSKIIQKGDRKWG